jgi:DinB superfamily
MTPDQILIAGAISSWQQVVARVGGLCSGLSEEQLLVEVAPGKNRVVYLWGHLTAIHDAMFTALRLGERLHPELDGIFITQPDRSMPLPTSEEIAKCWEAIHAGLLGTFTTLTSG